jgi:hypothetical protein
LALLIWQGVAIKRTWIGRVPGCHVLRPAKEAGLIAFQIDQLADFPRTETLTLAPMTLALRGKLRLMASPQAVGAIAASTAALS